MLWLDSRVRGNGMKGLSLKGAHEEVVSLVRRAVEEFEEGEVQVGISILLEAQFLLSELIEQELNHIDSAPPLSPFIGESVDGQVITAIT